MIISVKIFSKDGSIIKEGLSNNVQAKRDPDISEIVVRVMIGLIRLESPSQSDEKEEARVF